MITVKVELDENGIPVRAIVEQTSRPGDHIVTFCLASGGDWKRKNEGKPYPPECVFTPVVTAAE